MDTERLRRGLMEGKLSVLCFGAGAIGSYIGGSLASTGHEVVFYDRPDTILRIKNNGIHIKPIAGPAIDLNNPILRSDLNTTLNEFNFDFSILAVKSYDTEELLKQFEGFTELIPPVLCLQNGVENEAKIREIVGEENVIAGTVTTAIGKNGEGAIIVEKLRGIGVNGNRPLSRKIIDGANAAGLNAIYYPDEQSMKWSKLLTNLTANASSAILNMPPGEILKNEKLFNLEIEQLRETLRVMKSMGIKVCDLPGTPVKLFAFIVKYIPTIVSKRILIKAMASGRGGKMPSFHIDLMSGRKKSEVDYLNGAVVRFGYVNKIETPVNRFLTETLINITNGSLPQSTFEKNPEKFLKAAEVLKNQT